MAGKMTTKTTPLSHPGLGKIQGTLSPQHPQIEQYLGLQYAKLANRFARGSLNEDFPAVTDATKIGPLPVADPHNVDNEHLLLQHQLDHPEYQFSDTECLTLNVTVPCSDGRRGETAGPLPVVVFMHGGGFVTGSANWPQWNLAPLVEHSVKIGRPVVAVGINYRLGPFGFLTSKALRDAGFKANNGLHDQKLALRWTNKYISGFGGDPGRMTYIGSSMGAASGFFHLQSNEPLFSQLVALGGSPLIQPLPAEVAEVAYSIVTGALGLDKLPPADQVKALLEVPAAELSSRLSNVAFPISGVVDDDIVRAVPTFTGLSKTQSFRELFPGAEWCKTLLIGDGQFDGMIMEVTALAHRTDNLAASLRRALESTFADDTSKVAAVLDGFGIDESSGDTRPVFNLINDIVFAQAAKATARGWAAALGTKAFLAHFNMPNPWPGAYRGEATHALDAAVLLGNYNGFLGAGQRRCAERMATDVVSLAQGGEPFPPYEPGEGTAARSMVYFAAADDEEDGSRVVEDADEGGTGRRGVLERVAEGQPEVLDKLLGVFGLLVQGPK